MSPFRSAADKSVSDRSGSDRSGSDRSVSDRSVSNAVTGAGLLRVTAVMDRLRSTGGCPWDAEQTHDSLRRYLVEECYELLQAIEDADHDAIREELGDVLLQVLFHARIAAERDEAGGGFDIDDVADTLAEKLIRRHPHVFADAEPIHSAADQQRRWDELKKTEHGRSSVVAGVALGQPAVALAAKLGARVAKSGLTAAVPTGDSVAEQIFRIAYAAGAAGRDPESELRSLAKQFAADLVTAESVAPEFAAPVPADPDVGADGVRGS